MNETGRTIQSVRTSCEILQVLQDHGGARIATIADELEMSRGNVHHHLNTLRQEEFVKKEGDEYGISLKFVAYAESAKQSVTEYDVVRSEVEQLAQDVGEVVNFAVEEHSWVVYLHKERGEGAVHTAAFPGTRLHMHCSALGKAILAQNDREEVEAVLEKRGMPAYTDQTIQDKETLWSQLETIRETGVSHDYEEVVTGVRCVAVPLRTPAGDVFGAISVSGPSQRLTDHMFEETLPQKLAQSANVIEVNLLTTS
ncbi:IclR family transcriptional regulator [Natrononativus amylolyticus]|uniref:IclR family transcriptional regulator n=1 Tax=Natrononativus amylolyticus TaxID=2963434 RepID=UPI0020CD3385|nr:IclR family transcriptional regulator [Natrononativus amylolyticus]